MTNTTDLKRLAGNVSRSPDLRALIDNLRAFERAYSAQDDDRDTESALKRHGVDICELPTFGGATPRKTTGVWSWDDDRLLVGEGAFSEWHIIDRPQERGGQTDQQKLIETLEKLVDSEGLYAVTSALELLCHEKAEHLITNWQDARSAKNWTRAASTFYAAHKRLERIQGIT